MRTILSPDELAGLTFQPSDCAHGTFLPTPGCRCVAYARAPGKDNLLRLHLRVTGQSDGRMVCIPGNPSARCFSYASIMSRDGVENAKFEGTIVIALSDVFEWHAPEDDEDEMRGYVMACAPGLTRDMIDRIAAVAGRLPDTSCEHADLAGLELMVNSAHEPGLLDPTKVKLKSDTVDRDFQDVANIAAELFDDESAEVHVDRSYERGENDFRCVIASSDDMAIKVICWQGPHSDDGDDACARITLVCGDAETRTKAVERWKQQEVDTIVEQALTSCERLPEEMRRAVGARVAAELVPLSA